MRTIECIVVAASLASVLPIGAVGQSMPVKARVRETVTVVQNGRVVNREVKQGFLYRNSRGSTLQQWTDMKGSVEKPFKAELMDNEGLALYQIDYSSKTAVQKKKLDKPAFAELSPPNSEIVLGQDYVNGIACTRIPAWVKLRGKEKVRAGESCFAESLGLTVRHNAEWNNGSQITRVSMEMSQIETGHEPDPALFKLRELTVLAPKTSVQSDSTESCTTCSR